MQKPQMILLGNSSGQNVWGEKGLTSHYILTIFISQEASGDSSNLKNINISASVISDALASTLQTGSWEAGMAML